MDSIGFAQAQLEPPVIGEDQSGRARVRSQTKLRAGLAALAVAMSLAIAGPASAASNGTQTVTGTVAMVLGLTVGTSSVNLVLNPTASPATASAGNVTVTTNGPYDLVVTDTGGLATTAATRKYLADALEASTTSVSGSGTPVRTLAAIDAKEGTASATGLKLGSGAGGTSAGDVYGVTLSQAVTYADAPGTYSDTLTYTVSAAP